MSMKNPEEYKQEMLRMYRQNPAARQAAVQTIQPAMENTLRPGSTGNVPVQGESAVENSLRPDGTGNVPAQGEPAMENSLRPDGTGNMPAPEGAVIEDSPEPVAGEDMPVQEESAVEDIANTENAYLKEEALPVKESGRDEVPPVTERYPEPRLPSYISPMFAPEEEEPYEIPKNEQGTGYIEVRVTTGRGAVPVEGASVIISSGGNGKQEIIRILTTNSSGNTGRTALPAPKRSGAQTQEALNDYSIYNVSVYFKSFFREESQDIPVFDGITSVQSFDLIPKPYEYDGQDGTIMYENPEPVV